jgi:uncharacterized surface protein with fasciclin (FAS1) repeats
MKISSTLLSMLSAVLFAASGAAFAQGAMMGHHMSKTTMVGGSAMYRSKNIVQNAMNSDAHKTLVAAVKQAGLVKALEGAGPFTVFAPTDDAFEYLPKGILNSLMKDKNKDKLKSILLYHVVKGRVGYKQLKHMIMKNGGKAKLKTLNGHTLTAMMNGDVNIVIKDDKGHIAHISTYDVWQSNGVIHVVDHVLLP